MTTWLLVALLLTAAFLAFAIIVLVGVVVTMRQPPVDDPRETNHVADRRVPLLPHGQPPLQRRDLFSPTSVQTPEIWERTSNIENDD